MPEPNNQEQQQQEQQQQMSDMDIATQANQLLRERDAQIKSLQKELAQSKLLQQSEDEVEEPMTREEAINTIGDSRTTNYDYAVAVCALRDAELAAGHADPLGKNGQAVYDFFKEVIEECDGDKNLFPSLYSARLGADDPQLTMANKTRRK